MVQTKISVKYAIFFWAVFLLGLQKKYQMKNKNN